MRDNREQFFIRRVQVLGFLFCLGVVVVLMRVSQFQVFEHEKLFQLSTGQSLKSITMRARRGHLYDRNGAPLASSIDVPSVYANPHLTCWQNQNAATHLTIAVCSTLIQF